MQTEQVPRAHTTGIGVDGSLTDSSPYQQHSPLVQSPLAVVAPMAVKQEPKEDEERRKSCKNTR